VPLRRAGGPRGARLQGLSAKPADLAAGANSNVNIHIGFADPSDQVKDLTVHLPPGLVGNPTAAPLCTPTQLNGDNCPSASQVGSVTAKVNVVVAGPVAVPLTIDGSLYNLVPHQGEPARFGIVLRAVGGLPGTKIIQQSGVSLRRSDFGLDTVVNDFPRTASGLETDITSLDLSLRGKVNGKGFMRNPTSCTPKTFTFDATSYAGHSVHGSAASFTPTDCGALPFSPSLTAKVGAGPATRFPSLTTTIKQDPGEAGLRAAKVLLPDGLGPNLDALNHVCTLARFRADASGCPLRRSWGGRAPPHHSSPLPCAVRSSSWSQGPLTCSRGSGWIWKGRCPCKCSDRSSPRAPDSETASPSFPTSRSPASPSISTAGRAVCS
jgi:hypothetical protein